MNLQALPEGGAPTSAQLVDHGRTLNLMVKALMARPGIKLWCVDRVTVFLENDKTEYTFGTDHITLTSDVVRTTLSAAASSGATSLSITDTSSMLASDYIGIELDDGTVQWTTINGAPTSTTATATTALTGAAAAGNQVYSYTTKYARGAKYALEAYLRDKNLTDTPINIVSRKEYGQFSPKNGDGVVTNVYLDPQLSATVLRVYQQADVETDALELTIVRTLEDFDAAGDTPDFPQEHHEMLVKGLTARLASQYGKSISERAYLDQVYEKALLEVEGFDTEMSTSIMFQPDFTYGG
jgi:hypothetical protein